MSLKMVFNEKEFFENVGMGQPYPSVSSYENKGSGKVEAEGKWRKKCFRKL
jgi:hypothetical protein